jgi:hypothetical protein
MHLPLFIIYHLLLLLILLPAAIHPVGVVLGTYVGLMLPM